MRSNRGFPGKVLTITIINLTSINSTRDFESDMRVSIFRFWLPGKYFILFNIFISIITDDI